MRLHKTFAMIAVVLLSSAAVADVSDGQVRDLIVRTSVAAYSGSCPCPYNVDRAGRECGARSAWSRAGGTSPTCYPNEITDEQVKAFRMRHEIS